MEQPDLQFIRLLKETCQEFLAFLREWRASQQLPEHMSVQQVADYLGKERTSLYRSIIPHKLAPCAYVGNNPYFKKADVIEFMNEYPKHEKGAHTYTTKGKK